MASSGGHVFAGLSGGGNMMCALTPGGDPWCWGRELPSNAGVLFSAAVPTPISGAPPLVTLSAGALHACGLTAGGAAYCWGTNDNGQLGTGDTAEHTSAVAVKTGLRFTSIGVGFFQTCAVTPNGAAYCWGGNVTGELGNPAGAFVQTTPMAVSGGHVFVGVRAGTGYSCALTAAGAAYCWGDDFAGELGDGSRTERTAPVLVAGGITFAALYSYKGNSALPRTCGIATTGSTYCWGAADSGALGTSSSVGQCPENARFSFACATTPARVAGGHHFSVLSIGWSHGCGIAVGGSGYCWGQNDQGQLGDRTTITRPIPVRVAGNLVFR
jgi:alpha-tubulin suppressor-like RCC1 family protein